MRATPKINLSRDLRDNLLREKADTADDPAWLIDQIHPGAVYVTAGGTADDGDYTIALDILDASFTDPTDIVFTRGSGESLAEIAEGLYDLLVLALDPDDLSYDANLNAILDGVLYIASGTVVYLIPKQQAPKFTVTATGTGGTGTLDATPEDNFPITGFAATQQGEHKSKASDLAIVVLSIDSNGDPAQDDNTCTFTIQSLRTVDRTPANASRLTDTRPGVAASVAESNVSLGQEVRIQNTGGQFTVRLTSIAQEPTDHDHFEVRWKEASV